MTRVQFCEQFDRLCVGFRVDMTREQTEAFYERLQHVTWPDWQEAVTDLLCAPRFPTSLSYVLDVIERRASTRRAVGVARARVETEGRPLGEDAPDDYCVKRALRRWVKGGGELKKLLEEEYVADRAAGKITAHDQACYQRFMAR